MARLVEACALCRAPQPAGAPELTLAAFKREVRDLQVWCSSSMIAAEGNDPVGVLVGAKREAATLVRRMAVHPAHQRRGHGRHLLASLNAKLAILGPPRILAEIPEDRPEAAAFFEACGYARETTFTDLILETAPPGGAPPPGSLLVPVGVPDLVANGLLRDLDDQAWERAALTLRARADVLDGIGLVTEDRITAFVLFHSAAQAPGATIATLRADDGVAAASVVAALARRTGLPLRFPVVAPGEFEAARIDAAPWRAAVRTTRFATTARAL